MCTPDCGGQFRSLRHQQGLRAHGLTASTGRVATAGDNATMESFFARLQQNVLNGRTWQTRDVVQLAIVTWIERTYHRRRRQRAFGKLRLIEFEAAVDYGPLAIAG